MGHMTALPREEFAIICNDVTADMFTEAEYYEDIAIEDSLTLDWTKLFDECAQRIGPVARKLALIHGNGEFSVVSFRDESKMATIIRVYLTTRVLK